MKNHLNGNIRSVKEDELSLFLNSTAVEATNSATKVLTSNICRLFMLLASLNTRSNLKTAGKHIFEDTSTENQEHIQLCNTADSTPKTTLVQTLRCLKHI